MNVQAAPPTYTQAGGSNPSMGNPPMLGQQVPGMTGGLPPQGGLSVLGNPMAQQLQSQYASGGAVNKAEEVQSHGRGDDTMLIHMTPEEVNSLQGLAMAHGGSLTINPHTGLPEAGWLGKLLPTILGVALTATGVGAPLAAGLVAAGSTAATGSLKKGLLAGLQAYGGAAMGGAAGLGGKISSNAFGALSSKAGLLGANMGAGATAANLGTQAISNAAAPGAAFGPNAPLMGGEVVNAGSAAGSAAGQQVAKTGIAGVAQRFGQAARAGLPAGTPGIISKAAPMLAAQGLMSGVSGAMARPGAGGTSSGAVDNSYQGPYYAQQRNASFAPETSDILSSSKERRYFDVDMPEIRNTAGQLVQPGSSTTSGTPILQPVLNPKAKKGKPMYDFQYVPYMGGVQPEQQGYARGGEIDMNDGSFVLDARTVSEIGNGSSNAGMEALRRIGGRPVQGPGDGVSDSVHARIGGDQPARVARDEVIIPASAVNKMGKGNPKRGADKLYALMDKAHKARKNAKRGQDTGLRRGLA